MKSLALHQGCKDLQVHALRVNLCVQAFKDGVGVQPALQCSKILPQGLSISSASQMVFNRSLNRGGVGDCVQPGLELVSLLLNILSDSQYLLCGIGECVYLKVV